MSTLVTFFSAEGTTAKLAKNFAKIIEADIFEIVPQKPYTAADIRWVNPIARCNREQIGNKDVPVIGKIENFELYDIVYIGFPIWYGAQPKVVSTFCKDYDWSGKKVYVFATSGGSGIGKTAEKMTPFVKGATIVEAKIVKDVSEIQII